MKKALVNAETGIIEYPFGEANYKFDLMKVCCWIAPLEKELQANQDHGKFWEGMVKIMGDLGMQEATYAQAEVFYAMVGGAADQLKKKLDEQTKESLDWLTGSELTPAIGAKLKSKRGKKSLAANGPNKS